MGVMFSQMLSMNSIIAIGKIMFPAFLRAGMADLVAEMHLHSQAVVERFQPVLVAMPSGFWPCSWANFPSQEPVAMDNTSVFLFNLPKFFRPSQAIWGSLGHLRG